MSKKLEVLQMLEEAGPHGVRSDEFYRRFNGRGVARIYDLRHDGHLIESEPDGKYKRYFLKDHHDPAAPAYGSVKSATPPGAESGSEHPGGPESLFDLPAAPTAFDPYERHAA